MYSKPIEEAIARANVAFCKKHNMEGTYSNDFTPFFAEALIDQILREIAAHGDPDPASVISYIRMKYQVGIFKRGDRVRATENAGFHRGAVGVVEFVEPSYQRVWVLRDRSGSPVCYAPNELEYEDV
jgi:hypothetical protein